MKVMCLALLAYVAVLFVIDVDWGQVARHTLVPTVELDGKYLALLLAVLGAIRWPS